MGKGAQNPENDKSHMECLRYEKFGDFVASCPAKGASGKGAASTAGSLKIGSSTQSIANVSQAAESTSYVGVTAERMPTMKDAWTFHVKGREDELPEDECGGVQHMLIDSGASLHAGPADFYTGDAGEFQGRSCRP